MLFASLWQGRCLSFILKESAVGDSGCRARVILGHCRHLILSAWSTRVHAEQRAWKFDGFILSRSSASSSRYGTALVSVCQGSPWCHQNLLSDSPLLGPLQEYSRAWGHPNLATANMLQHAATCCNMLQHAATCCNMLQHAATCCNMLQHAATCCNTHHGSQHSTCGDVGDEGYWPMESSSSVISPCPCSKVWDRTFGGGTFDRSHKVTCTPTALG